LFCPLPIGIWVYCESRECVWISSSTTDTQNVTRSDFYRVVAQKVE
jgi:hypothetical protein